MARVEVPIVVINSATGLPVNGASVAITRRSTGAPATWWTAETGGTSSTASVATDANGRVNAWVDRGAYNAQISGTGITTYTEPFDAAPGSDSAVDQAWMNPAVLPSGLILPYGGTTAPTGYLMCQGGEFARATYPTLDAVIGTTFGAYTNGAGGAGTTHLRVPDLRGRAPIGAGTGPGLAARALAGTGGEENHTLTPRESGVNDLGSTTVSGHHQHQYQGEQFQPGGGTLGPHFIPNAGLDSTFALTLPENYWNSDHSHPLTGRTADQSHNNMQPWMGLNYIIKT